MPRHLLLLVLAIVASQAWPIVRLVPALPSAAPSSRSPSSDVLMQSLPYPDAAARLDVLSQLLPITGGVVVAHAPADQLASAYFVLAMRLWPRQVSFVACEPSAHLEQFRAAHAAPAYTWRIDLWPGREEPVVVVPTRPPQQAAALCATQPSGGAPPQSAP